MLLSIHHLSVWMQDILPNRRIGLLLINSCSSPLLVRQRLLDLHSGRLVLPDNSNRNSSFLLANIMGYAGAFFSGDSMAAADTLNDVGRPFVQVWLHFAFLLYSITIRSISLIFISVRFGAHKSTKCHSISLIISISLFTSLLVMFLPFSCKRLHVYSSLVKSLTVC